MDQIDYLKEILKVTVPQVNKVEAGSDPGDENEWKSQADGQI